MEDATNRKYNPESVELLMQLIFSPFRAVGSLSVHPWVSPTVIQIQSFQDYFKLSHFSEWTRV